MEYEYKTIEKIGIDDKIADEKIFKSLEEGWELHESGDLLAFSTAPHYQQIPAAMYRFRRPKN